MVRFLLKGILSLPFNQCSLSQKTSSDQKLDETSWFSSVAVGFLIHLARSQYVFLVVHVKEHLWLLVYVILKHTTVYLLLLLNHFCCVWLYATLWTVPCQSPLSTGFSKQEYSGGLHAFLQGIFLTDGSSLCLLSLLNCQAGSLPLAPPLQTQLSPKSFRSSHPVATLVLLSLIKIMSTLPLLVNCHNLASAILNHHSCY